MSEAWKIILTALATLVGGVILFILGEFARTLMIVPLQKYREHVETVLDRLSFYANLYTRTFSHTLRERDIVEIADYRSHMRSAAAQLKAKYTVITAKRLFVLLRIIPSKEKLDEAYKSLIYLSNSILQEGELDESNNAEANLLAAREVRSIISSDHESQD